MEPVVSASWKTIHVFVSSTFLDMQAERDYLVRFVFPHLRKRLLPHRIHLVDIDLRWGVTTKQNVLEVCRKIFDECRPRLLCVLGGRCGRVPPNKNHSITAEEVHYGILDRELTDRGLAYFYFRDDKATAAMVEVTPGEFRDPPGSDNGRRLVELKESIIAAGLNPFIYPAWWDDQSRRLAGLKTFGNRVFDELLSGIRSDPELRDRFLLSPATQAEEFADESAAMEAFVEEHNEHFVLGSREPILAELLAHASLDGYACLTGGPGSGKSALLAYLSRHPVLNDQASILLIRHFVGSSPGSTNVQRMLQRLCHELKSARPDIPAEIPNDPERLRVVFPEFLHRACEHRRVVILLDAVNQLDAAPASAGSLWLPAVLPPGISVILSASDGPALGELRSRLSRLHKIELLPLTASDGKAIIEKFCQRYRKSFDPEQLTSLLAKADAGTPLYLLAALQELRTLGTYQEITSRIIDLPPTCKDLFVWILKRLENDDGFRNPAGRRVGCKLVPRFAALLGTSRHGLTLAELTDLLDPKDPQGNVAAMLYLLRPYLMRRSELFDFCHEQFRAAGAQAWLNSPTQRRTAHTQLASYFRDRLAEPYDRALSELPHHLAAAGLDEELLKLTSNADYLEECVVRFGMAQLLESLRQLRLTVARDSPVLSQLIRQCEVLQGEAGSFADWNSERRFPDFFNQVANGAARRGCPGLFRRTSDGGSQGIRGNIWLQWSIGIHGADFPEQLPVHGTRDSYSWDIYDYGPLGCSTKVWIDLPRRRLLTDTVSAYGSFDTMRSKSTHEPREWDLESGALLATHPTEEDPWDQHQDIPRAFAGLVGLSARRQGTEIPQNLVVEAASISADKLIAVNVIGKSVNSEDTVFRVSIRKTEGAFGDGVESRLLVHDPVARHTYCASCRVDKLEIRAIARIERGLTVFATDSDGHVYRLTLVPQDAAVDQTPVLDVAVPEMPGEFACIRPTGIEVRATQDSQLLREFSRDNLTSGHDGSGALRQVPVRSDADGELKWTPDEQWLVVVDQSFASLSSIYTRDGAVALRGDVLSGRSGEWMQRDWMIVPPPDCFRNHPYNNVQGTLITRSGKYRLVKRRCSIDVWEVHSGRWVGSLGPGAAYGGGGNMYGIASHPNERFVISSDDNAGGLAVWDLEKGLECWRLNGIGPLGKICSLAFLWGGYLVAALTEEHMLYVLRFWWQSEIVAAIRLDQGCRRLIGTPYGNNLFVLYENGRLSCYRYVPRQNSDVTTIEGNTLRVRFRRAEAKHVHLAGTFNGWDPAATSLESEDGEIWQVTIELPDGKHEYKMVIDGERWELDPNVPFVPRTYGPNNHIDLPSVRPVADGP